MIRNISIRLLSNSHGLSVLGATNSRLFSTKQKTQNLEYASDLEFPFENGFEQNSLYSSEFPLPLCTLDQYVWQNFSQWQNHIAAVSLCNQYCYFSYKGILRFSTLLKCV
jgi:hypothetical protein